MHAENKLHLTPPSRWFLKRKDIMNNQIAQLKAALDAATLAYNTEQAKLVAQGLNSKARYPLLKDLKAAQDSANSAYVNTAHSAIKKELNKIIAADAPARAAAARSRSAWKQAKYDAAK